jgi:tellurite resistance protein TerC
MSGEVLAWGLFGLVVVAVFALDLGVLDRRVSGALSLKQALGRTALWVVVALLFNGAVWIWRGGQPALEFLTGYILEYSLSVDNLFVFLLVFSYFRVPAKLQHKALLWGIVGALGFRAVMIVSGVALVNRFHWVLFLFGAFLVFTGIRMAFRSDEEIHPEHNPLLKLFRKFVPVTKDYEGSRFFVRREGRSMATPLFVVLLFVETTDLMFAVDSIPAVIAVTTDPFIIYTSNIFAILGLRSLYFALAGIMPLFHYLQYGLSFILVFVGAKMLLADWYKIPVWAALVVIAGTLALSVLASLLWPLRGTDEDPKEN